MEFHEKVRRRVRDLDLNRSKAAREVHLPVSTINNYMSKVDSLPRIDIAAKIAKALKVPLEWLADDAADWPPPSNPDASALQLTDNELMTEVCRRFRLAAVPFHEKLVKAADVDWLAISSKLQEFPIDSVIPADAADATSLAVGIVNSLEQLFQFDPDTVVYNYHDGLPGKALDPTEMTLAALLNRWRAIRDANPGLLSVYDREMSRRAHSRHTRRGARSIEVYGSRAADSTLHRQTRTDAILDVSKTVRSTKSDVRGDVKRSAGDVSDVRRDVAGKPAQKRMKARKPQSD